MPRSRIVLATGCALLLSTACALEKPFERTSPFDPESIYELSLSGPDSTHSFGEQVQLVLGATPPLPERDMYIEWVAFDFVHYIFAGNVEVPVYTKLAQTNGDGSFIVIETSAEYRMINLAAMFDDVTVGHRLFVGQRAATLSLSCAPWTQLFTPCDNVGGIPNTLALHTDMKDALGAPLRNVGFAIERGALTSRNTNVIAPQPVTRDASGIVRFTVIGPGSTWVVVRIDDAVDSLLVTVPN